MEIDNKSLKAIRAPKNILNSREEFFEKEEIKNYVPHFIDNHVFYLGFVKGGINGG